MTLPHKLTQVIEVCTHGFADYIADMWNWMDMVNYAIFFIVYLQVWALTYASGRVSRRGRVSLLLLAPHSLLLAPHS